MKLPLFLKPIYSSDLIRVGKLNDGGYIVSKNSILDANYLVSFGLNDDWSFEKNFSEQEKKRQFLSSLSGGIVVPELLVKKEYRKDNQTKTIKYIDLEKYHSKNKPTEENKKELYEKNKNVFFTEFKSIRYVEIDPFKISGSKEYDEAFFKQLDAIENNILDGQSFDEAIKTNNLKAILLIGKLIGENVDPKEFVGEYTWNNQTPFNKFMEERINDTGVSQYHFNTNKLNDYYNFDLIPTGVNRSSSKILNDLEKNIDKILPLYDLTLHARKLLEREEYKEFVKCISENWNIKKSTSKYITQNKKVRDLDEFCEKRDQILAHKLLGAGNGGFFLVVTRKNEPLTSNIFNVILRNA